MRTIGLSVACLLACAAAPPLLAQGSEVPSRLSLADAVRLAEERHPSLAAAAARLDVAVAAVTAARQRPNPVLATSTEGHRPWARRDRLGDGTETVLEVSQEIETAGRRRLRGLAAEAGVAAGRASADDARRQLRLATVRAYFLLVVARSESEAATTALSEVDTVIRINRARYRQGEISGGELRRLEVERMRFSDDLAAARLAERNARAGLLTLLGAARLDAAVEPTDGLALPVGAAAQSGLDAAALTTRALSSRPDLAAARQAERRAQGEWELQRALRRPTLTLGAGYRRESGLNGVVVSAAVPLPLFDRNAAGLARAEAERRLAASEAQQVERSISLEVQQAVNAVEAVRTRLAALESEYLAAAKEARDSALAAYRSGATGLIDYLDAQRAWRDVQRAHQRTLFEHRLGLAELDAVVGTAPGVFQP